MSGTNYDIWCILGFEGDDEEPFVVHALSTIIFDDLKELIKQKKNAIAPKDLILWKVCFSDYF
jgi:NDP-sugar pyrophosphorylase family protein